MTKHGVSHGVGLTDGSAAFGCSKDGALAAVPMAQLTERFGALWISGFVQRWIILFNGHDLQNILSLYHDDFILFSPFIIDRMGVATGCLSGKQQIEPYWHKSLQQNPQRHFVLLDWFVGVDSLVVCYDNSGNRKVCESFWFDADGLVIKAVSQHGKEL